MHLRRSIEPADPTIHVSVRCPEQIFNSIDPSPFFERDLAPDAEQFILDWAHEVTDTARLRLVVSVAEPGSGGGLQHIPEAVHQQYRRRAHAASGELRQLFRRGRISALIGITFLAASVIGSDLVARAMGGTSTSQIIQLGLQLLGWVSTWRPIEIYLYDWWPLLGDRRLYDRLAAMPVEVLAPAG